MINEFYDSLQEAEQRAIILLSNACPQDSKADILSNASVVWEESPSRIYTISTDGSEDYALIFFTESEYNGETHEYARLCYIRANDKFTFPFRKLSKSKLPFLLMATLSSIPTFIKPNEQMSAAEAATLAGEMKLRQFFGIGYKGMKIQRGILEAVNKGEIELSISDAYANSDIAPASLSEVTGKPVLCIGDYYKAIETLTKRNLSEEERETLQFPYYFNRVEAFGLYCLYEFLLTEKYEALQQALKQYAFFGLPEGWQEDSAMNYGGEITNGGETLEAAVLNHYYNTRSFRFFSPVNIRELAEYANIPLRIAYKAMR